MLHRNFRVVLVILICALFLSAHPIQFYAQSNKQTTTPNEEELLALIAALKGYSAGELELADVSVVKLVNGVSIKHIKAVDPNSGLVVGAAFLGDQVVDEEAIRAQVTTEWRAEHGALTPDVVARMSGMSSKDTLDVAVWLAADVQPLPIPHHTPETLDEGGATSDISESSGESASPGESKVAAIPIPCEQVPDSVKAEIAQPIRYGAGPVEYEKTVDKSGEDFSVIPEAEKVETRKRLAQIESLKQQNEAGLREQLAPLKARFLKYVRSHGLRLAYNSEITPVVILETLTFDQLQTLSQNPDVDAIYEAANKGWPALDNARETQNGVLVNQWGDYTGDGVNVAVVESSRPPTNHPYLSIATIRDTDYPYREHPVQVGGIFASTYPGLPGFSPDVTLFFSNAGVNDPWPPDANWHDAIDWGAINAAILNNSWNTDCGKSDTMDEFDRHLDFIVRYLSDLAVVASGNHRTQLCDGQQSAYASSPGQGYNTLTVGAFKDQNNPQWSGDVIRESSQYNEDGRIKPEMVASGDNITTLLAISPWYITTGGTSLAAPMVAATAANMVQANPSLSNYPEAVTAVLMASALHNIVDDGRLSRPDGAGALDAAAALVNVEGAHWASQTISSSTAFPLEFSHFAYRGERVRYVIRWLSNPDSGYTSDPLPADLDLAVYRADGTTYITGSFSGSDSFEIVDFIAPASESFVFKVSLFGTWSGGSTRLGRGWWNGTKRYSPDTGYQRPKAPPMGFHISVYPTDWSPSDNWRAFGIRPINSDHDLRLFSRSIFDDPYWRSSLATSNLYGEAVDLITVDGHHRSSGDQEQYVILNDSGEGDYKVSWSNPGVDLTTAGIYGPYSMDHNQVVKVFDVRFEAGETRRIRIIPFNNSADLAVRLYQSDSADPATWTQSKNDQVAGADSSTSPDQTEDFVYTYTGTAADTLGLVVYSNDNANASFYIYLPPNNDIYLPLVIR